MEAEDVPYNIRVTCRVRPTHQVFPSGTGLRPVKDTGGSNCRVCKIAPLTPWGWFIIRPGIRGSSCTRRNFAHQRQVTGEIEVRKLAVGAISRLSRLNAPYGSTQPDRQFAHPTSTVQQIIE